MEACSLALYYSIGYFYTFKLINVTLVPKDNVINHKDTLPISNVLVIVENKQI